jgi:hypothetical protein
VAASPEEGFIGFEKPGDIERCSDEADKELPLKEVIVQRPI